MQDNDKDKNNLPDNSPAKTTPEETSPSKEKKSWIERAWKAFCEWWKLTWESYRVEVEDRILMSWKRIIKFCGITIIPILYGVICSIAMWNPVEALGKATTYVMDDDYSVLLVTDTDQNTGKFDFGAVKYFNNDNDKQTTINILTKGTGLKAQDIVFDPDLGAIGIQNDALKNEMERQKITSIIFNNANEAAGGGYAQFHLDDEVGERGDAGYQEGSTVNYKPNDAGFTFKLATTWDVVKSAFNKKTDPNIADNKYKFSAPAFLTHPEVSLQNVHYSTDKKWNDKYYQHRQGWIQAKIPTGYTSRALNYISLMMKQAVLNSSKNPNPDKVNLISQELNKITGEMKPLGLWTTYQRNFLFGYMFDMMSGLLGQYLAMQMPSALNTAAVSNLSQYLTTDGPTLASLTADFDDVNKNPIINLPNGQGDMDMSQRYLLVDSQSLTNAGIGTGSEMGAKDRLQSLSLFGNTDGKTVNEVGGKFINTLNTARTFLIKGLPAILGNLGGDGTSSGINGLVNSVKKLVDSIIKIINGERETGNATYDDKAKTLTYELNGVKFFDGSTPTADQLAKDFTVKDSSGADVSKDVTYKYDSGTITVTINKVSLDSNGKAEYTLSEVGSATNNMTWDQPITYVLTKPKDTHVINSAVKLDANPTNNDYDEALILINKAVWQVVTGQQAPTTNTTVDKAITTIWGMLGLPGTAPTTAALAKLQGVDFLKNQTIMSETNFDKAADGFINANSTSFNGATTVNEVLPKLVNKIANDKLFGLKLGNLVTYKIQGAEFGYEGIGIGLFFLTVGLYVGTMLDSFIFDRAKRLTRAKWSNWYFSKTLLMLTIAFFQVTAEVWIVYAAGWHAIGGMAMFYVWLWLLASDSMFVVIIQALWFSLKDEIIGKFLMVIVLVTSIAAGGGEFPAFSEFGFFHGISYIVPFTYVINGFDTITFAISLNGTHGDTTRFMFSQWGIEWIYIAIFLTFGMVVGAQLRMKEMNYGSHYGFAVAGAMRALGKDASDFQVLRKVTRKGRKRYYYNWKALPDAFVPELYFQCRRMYKFAGEFKWWQRKHHDFVQKPNYSDEEIIQRNE